MRIRNTVITLLMLCAAASPEVVHAAIIRGFGAGFGGITGLGEVGQNLRLGFAGSITVKGPRFIIPFELYVGMSSQQKKETENTKLKLLPVFLSTRVELKRSDSAPGIWPYFRIGLGGIFEWGKTSHQGAYENFDPGLLLAVGMSKGIGRKVSLNLDISYIFAFQTTQQEAEYNGHFLMLGLGLYWVFQK